MLGAGRQLKGVTHECNYPHQALAKTCLVKIPFKPQEMNGFQIDSKVRELIKCGQKMFEIDTKALGQIRPDLVITQDLCEVCSPFSSEISRSIDSLENKPKVLVLDPHTLDDVLDDVEKIATAIGKCTQATKILNNLRRRESRIYRLAARRPKPKILCLEWMTPFFTAGHWIPQMVELAGGINGLSLVGERSRETQINEIKRFDPDKIVLMPCGFDLPRTMNEYLTLARDDEWMSLRAVNEGQVYAVDANSYFSKPGPRIVAGLEILAKIILPERMRSVKVPKSSYERIGKRRRVTESMTLRYTRRLGS